MIGVVLLAIVALGMWSAYEGIQEDLKAGRKVSSLEQVTHLLIAFFAWPYFGLIGFIRLLDHPLIGRISRSRVWYRNRVNRRPPVRNL